MWNGLEYGKYSLYILEFSTLLHSEALTEFHVYFCKRMYIVSALFYCNSNRISHTSRCVSQFSVLDVGQILIIHKKQEIKQIFFSTTIIYWEYQLFVNKRRAPPTGAGRLTFSYPILNCKQVTKLYILLTCQQIGVTTFYKCIEFQVNSFDSYWEILSRGSALSWACVAHLAFCSEKT